MRNNNNEAMATRLGLTIRRVQQLEDAGVIVRRPNSDAFDIEENARAYRVYADHDIGEVCRQIEAEVVAVDAGLDKLRTAKSQKQRMKLARAVGPHVGALNNALRLSVAMGSPGSRQLLTSWTDMVMGRVIGDFFALAHLEIRDDPA